MQYIVVVPVVENDISSPEPRQERQLKIKYSLYQSENNRNTSRGNI